MELSVKQRKLLLVVAISSTAVAACTNTAQLKENMLSSSGFKAVAPKTPKQVASLKSLPAHQLTKTTYKGGMAWIYADPTVCGCLYVGDQGAYEIYQRNAAQAKAIDAREAANARATMASMTDLGLDWE